MTRSNDPSDKAWKQIYEDLRELEETVDLYKKRFEAADREDISKNLEECILKLITAEVAALELDLKERGGA
jgi:hypothetical protein